VFVQITFSSEALVALATASIVKVADASSHPRLLAAIFTFTLISAIMLSQLAGLFPSRVAVFSFFSFEAAGLGFLLILRYY